MMLVVTKCVFTCEVSVWNTYPHITQTSLYVAVLQYKIIADALSCRCVFVAIKLFLSLLF